MMVKEFRSGGVRPCALDTKWKIAAELRRRLLAPVARLYLACCGVRIGPRSRLFGMPIVQRHRRGSIEIGADFSARSWIASNPLATRRRCVLSVRSPGASILIGDSVGMTAAVVVSERSVRIGDRVRIGANVTIVDTDFHPLSESERRVRPTEGASSPIIIEDDVFIGMHAIVLKGATIGRGAVIGAGSVVSGRVEANTIVAGNPARFVRVVEN